MSLSGRQCCAAVANARLVSLGELQDHLVRAGLLAGRDDGSRRRIFVEPRDVLGNRTIEEFDVLGEVTYIYAQSRRRPLVQCAPV